MSAPAVVYGPANGEGELGDLSEILSESFGASEADNWWWKRFPKDDLRVVRDDSGLLGGLGIQFMGQYFGGKRIEMGGIAGVGIRPDRRGRGVARHLMAETVRELHERHVPLSVLFSAAHDLYRGAGYENAGAVYRVRTPVASLPSHKGDVTVRPFSHADLPLVNSIYSKVGCHRNGHLDRDEFEWLQAYEPRGQKAKGYVFEENGTASGYVFVIPAPSKPLFDLAVLDLCALTSETGLAALSFLGTHRSQFKDATWLSGPSDPLLLHLPRDDFRMTVQDPWMLRIVDVPRALAERGYPSAVSARLDFQVQDDIVKENCKRFRLEVDAGRGSVIEGGEGTLALDVRGLAALYSGHMDARSLSLAGLLRAPAAAMEAASAAFAGQAPWMTNQF